MIIKKITQTKNKIIIPYSPLPPLPPLFLHQGFYCSQFWNLRTYLRFIFFIVHHRSLHLKSREKEVEEKGAEEKRKEEVEEKEGKGRRRKEK
jgi:hypothetical protein